MTIGEYYKVEGTIRVFKVVAFTQGMKGIPDGWPLDKDGYAYNPINCKKYNGAISVLNH